jgi:hypothetical protein
MRHHFRHSQAMFNKGSLFYSHCGLYSGKIWKVLEFARGFPKKLTIVPQLSSAEHKSMNEEEYYLIPIDNQHQTAPDRKVCVYLICNFEIKFGFNLCPR